MKHILILLTLLPELMFAQKGVTPKVIKLPIYNASTPINEVWIERVDSADKVSIAFENPNFAVEKFDLIIDNKGSKMRIGGIVNESFFGLAYYISFAANPEMKIMIHCDHIYLKGNLRTANWTYRVHIR